MENKQLIQKAQTLAPLVIDAAKRTYEYIEKNLGKLKNGSQEEKHLKFDCLFFYLLVADFLTFGVLGNSEQRNIVTDNLYWEVVDILSKGVDDTVLFKKGINVLYQQFSQDMQGLTLFSEDSSKQVNKLLQWQFAKRVLMLYRKWPRDMILMLQFIGILNEEIKRLDIVQRLNG